MRIALRADGDAKVGLGHLGRCAALAQAFAALGERPVFLDVAPSCRGWLEERGLRWRAGFSGRWDVLVADSYRFSARDFAAMRKAASTFLVLDDSGSFRGACDWVLNGHPYARSLRFAANGGSGLILGPKFLPLRSEYWRRPAPRPVAARVKRVLITLGGGDGWGLLDRVLAQASAALPDAELHAVLGPLAQTPSFSGARVVWHRSPASLRPLIERCDLGISAGGQTLYEFAWAGAPSIALELGPDQRGNLESVAEAGVSVVIGKPGARSFSARLRSSLKRLDRDASARARMSAAGRALVDGLGAPRVASLLLAGARA